MNIVGSNKKIRYGVKVGEYADPVGTNGIIGYIEPACENPQWILWFTEKGDAIFYTAREPGGAVKGEPIRVKAQQGQNLKKTIV